MTPLILALLALPAAQDVAQPAPAPAVPADKPVCRREQTLGSFLPKRVCHSRAQWVAIDRANNDSAEAALTHRRSGMTGRD